MGSDSRTPPIVTARVVVPDESQSVASAALTGAEDAVLICPDAFGDANTMLRGAYAVIWETEGGFWACDGRGRGSQPVGQSTGLTPQVDRLSPSAEQSHAVEGDD